MLLSYIITTFAPKDVNKRFLDAKNNFNLVVKRKTKRGVVIAQNTAHITLKRTFYLKPGIMEETIIDALGKIIFKPMSVFADELSIFHSPKLGNVLVAIVQLTPELSGLHNQISRAIDWYIDYEKQEFIPHLSILYNLPETSIQQAKAYAFKYVMPVSFTLDSFNLLKDTGITKERVLVKGYYP